MPTKIRNVELLTLARSDAGTPVLGHVGVGIDANLIQDFEMGLSRAGSAAQFNLALNVEGATTNTAHYGGIAFTQGASADTIMASIKAVNTSVDGYIDLSFNTRSVTNVLYIKADGKVGVKKIPTTYALEVDGDVQATNFRGAFIGDLTGNVTGTVSTLSNHDTDDLSEGSSNLYFTNERAQDAIGTMLSGNTETLITVTYDDSNNEIDFVVDNDLSNYSNTSSAFITLSSISVTDSGGDGSLAYNNSTGVITYAGPSASDVRAHFSAGTGIGISSGEISIGQAVATGSNVVFNQVTAALVGNASTATTLETARNIVVGKSVAGAGDIDAITQSFNGGANISFDSTLNSHLPADLRGTTSDNIADEPSNNAVKIIGSDINTPRLKINRQGLIVGFEEVATSGGGGSGGISALTLTTNGLLYLNAGLTTQTETTSTSTPTLNLYLKSAGLFTALTESGGTMSVTVGGTTKTLALPNASFTQFQRISSTQLQATVGTTQLTADLSGASVANATNATNAANVAIAANATDSARYLTFVTGSSGNLPLLMDTGITYNPSSNTLATTNFVGALSGNATTSSGLLIGSTTYLPSTSATSTNNLVARNASSQVHIKELVLSDNTTSSSLSMFIGKISGSDILHEFSGGQALALLGINTIFTGNGPYAISVTGNAATATTAAACSGNAATATVAASTTKVVAAANATNADQYVAFLDNANTTAQQVLYDAGITYNPSSNTLSTTTFAGALSGNASSATGLVWSGATRSPSSAATANTIAVRGSGGALTIAGLTCTTVGATTMSAQSLELTNQGTGTNFSLKVHNIVPKGTLATFGSGSLLINYVSDSSIGDHDNASVGAFARIDAYRVYSMSTLAYSDRRLKENISPFELGLDFVRLLEPKSYNRIGSKTPRKYYGAIAQEVAEVMKEIGIEDESMISIRGHHEKTEEEREQAVKTYDPQQIMWVLFNAVKQLDAEVQDLKKELKK
jgi:hypothetical protein